MSHFKCHSNIEVDGDVDFIVKQSVLNSLNGPKLSCEVKKMNLIIQMSSLQLCEKLYYYRKT